MILHGQIVHGHALDRACHGSEIAEGWRWEFFTPAEFACRCCAIVVVDSDLVDVLEELRFKLQVPLPISSGYRCPNHNARVSGTGRKGPHTTGRAVDVRISGRIAFDLLALAFATPRITGIGIHQRGPHAGRYIHLDVLPIGGADHPRPAVWSYYA